MLMSGYRRLFLSLRAQISSSPHPMNFRFKALLLFFGLFAARVPAIDLQWTPLHEPSVGGWVNSFAVSPHDSRRVLIGGDILGIGLSTDGGESWQGTYGLKCWEIEEFTWHPTESNRVWAATMGGLYRSDDAGRNWRTVRSGFPPANGGTYSTPLQTVRYDPNNPNRLLAFGGSHREYQTDRPGEWGAVWESTNGGESWKKLSVVKSGGGNIMAAGFAAGSSTRVFAAVNDYGVVRSGDGGKTWSLQTNGLPTENVKDLILHPTRPDTLYVALDNYSAGQNTRRAGGIWASTNAGATWISRSVGLRQNTGSDGNFVSRFKTVALAPANPELMVTADTSWDNSALFFSRDGGTSWNRSTFSIAAMPTGPSMTCAEFDPNDPQIVFSAGSDSALRSSNGGAAWTDVSSFRTNGRVRGRGYSGWVTTRFGFHPVDSQRALFTALDHGFGWQSRDGLETWTRGAGLPIYGGAQDFTWTTNDTIYLSHGQFGYSEGIARSRDGGRNFSLLKGPARGLPDSGQPGGILARRDLPDHVWVAWNGLRRSTNGGANWSRLAVPAEPRWLAADPGDPARLFVSAADGVYTTTDAGASFTRIPGAPADATRLTVDTLGRVLVTTWRREGGGLFRFASNQWTRLRGDRYLADVAADPRNPRRLMAVSNDHPYHDETFATGVWTSEDDGRTWRQQNNGLAQLRCETVAVSPHDPDLWIVGTGGRGFFVTRWSELQLRPEGAGLPPSWQLQGPPNRWIRLETAGELGAWQPVATNRIPANGLSWAQETTADAEFLRAKVLAP